MNVKIELEITDEKIVYRHSSGEVSKGTYETPFTVYSLPQIGRIVELIEGLYRSLEKSGHSEIKTITYELHGGPKP